MGKGNEDGKKSSVGEAIVNLPELFSQGVCDVCSASNNQQCHIFSFRKSLLA